MEILIGILALSLLLWPVLVAAVVVPYVLARGIVRGIVRLRFSLQAMMITILSGGACVTLMLQKDPRFELCGVVCASMYIIVLVSHVLVLGNCTSEGSRQRQ